MRPIRRASGPFAWKFTSTIGICMFLATGCGRSYYRNHADKDVGAILREREIDPRWNVPNRPVEPDPRSRMSDPTNPDKTPIPPDDPAARKFQVSARKPFEFHGWRKRGNLPAIEDPSWLDSLPRDAQGKLQINQRSSLELGILHSREYQTRVEDLYLAALGLSLGRFEYQLRYTAGHDAAFVHSGSTANESNRLELLTQAGIERRLMSGGQLVVDFANSFVFEFTGASFDTVSSNLLVGLTQPLLRGAFARIRTQALSQQERDVLYQLRSFAHFRRQFYVDTVADTGYLGLLLQLQGIRNIENNLESLKRNLEEHEELATRKLIAQIQRDQVYQRYQSSQALYLTAKADLETALDRYKQRLGLPPSLPIHLDDTPLKTFELNSAMMETLQKSGEELYLSMLQFDKAPSKPEIAAIARTLLNRQMQLQKTLEEVDGEMIRWKTRLDDSEKDATKTVQEQETIARNRKLAKSSEGTLEEVRLALASDLKTNNSFVQGLTNTDLEEAWKKLRDMVGRDFRERVADVFVSQIIIRVFLIELPIVDLKLADAIDIGMENRLDLANSLAEVTDAWRSVEVAADALQSDLTLKYQGSISTDPTKKEALRFDASNSSHRVGVEFDAPITRKVERNAYRTSQIGYQRARRQYMATEDTVHADIRRDLRVLEQTRRQFEISRDQLVTASRQVDEAQINLRTQRDQGSSLTTDLLNALQSLLDAKNSLISNWVSYQTARMTLFRDLDTMEIDAQGVWTNEHDRVDAAHSGLCRVEVVDDPELRAERKSDERPPKAKAP